jgi:hypothetical protein
MDIESALKTIGDWISKETESRKYPKGELLELSESLQVLKAAIARQSVTDEAVWRTIDWLETGDFEIQAGDTEYTANSSHHPNTARFRETAITALRQYQKPTDEGRFPDEAEREYRKNFEAKCKKTGVNIIAEPDADVAEAIDQVEETRRKAQKELDALIETKSRYDHQIEIGDP